MSAAVIVDPDLEQAIEDLGFAVRRIRQIEDMLLEPDHVRRYPDLTRMLTERTDLHDRIAQRAAKLNLAPRALALIVIEAEAARSKARGRRAIPLEKLLVRIQMASDIASADRAATNADLIHAHERAKAASTRATGLANAIAYLEASR